MASRFVAAFVMLIVLLACQTSFGQSNTTAKWGRFNLLAVDTAWKYKSGQALPGSFGSSYNDGNWQTVSNAYLDQISPASPNWRGIGVFRKKFSVPDSLKGRKVELLLGFVGTTEIYLDGALLSRFGDVAGKSQDQMVFQKTVPFMLDSAASHVLAIYYANRINPSLVSRYNLAGYGINLGVVTSGESNSDYYFDHMLVSLGIILSFCIFFWCIYAFYPNRLASLVTALQLTNFSLIFIGGMLRDYTSPDFIRFVLGQRIWETGFSCTFGWALILVYTLYYRKITWRIWAVGALMFVTFLLVLFQASLWFNVARVLIVLYMIDTWRVLILGLRNKRTGFWILAIGFFFNIAGTVFVIFDLFHVFPWYITSTQNILGVITDLSFPLTLALHLAWEFGSANRDLEKQLVQVTQLSKKSLEQEQEKQQILATQKENLEQQVAERTSELNSSLNELKTTQTQLIQKEKMASLGELTAGIAHEIQNPLNFVNNFSSVNQELFEEMEQEFSKGNVEEAKAIAKDIKANEEKIAHHGKRADSIVKGMLQHARQSSGKKEPTDINKLVDEYLRLSYQGMRARDKSFNSEIQTSYDITIGEVNVVAQDIGRVLLNLFNNAFYAVSEKKAKLDGTFEAVVSVTTKRESERILITVKDNGTGMSEKVKEKAFQPFFTTKPTGEGTGLGLSLSYDIVTKGHGGTLSVKSTEGEGSEFVVQLPV